MSILKAFDTKGAIISTPPSTGLSIILLCCIGRSSCWITKIESEVWKLEVSCVSVFSVFFACEWPSFLPFLLDHWTLGFISRLLCPLMFSPLTPPPCLIPPWPLHWNHQRKLNRNAPQCLHQQMKPKRRLKKRKKFARVQLKPGGATWRWSFSQFNPTLAAGPSHGNLKPTESIFYILIIYSTCCWEEIFT